MKCYTPQAYNGPVFTVVETLLFQKLWPLYWTEDERGAFAAFISQYPMAGDVVPGSGGIRNVGWSRRAMLTGAKLKEIRRALDD